MLSTLEAILKKRSKHGLSLKDFTPSAVLIPFFEKEGDLHLLLTLRNDKVRHHKGEVCFPGGVFDPDDVTLRKTALRESFEELGLLERDIQPIGELDDLVTPTLYRISPFVAQIPYPYPFKINTSEIAEILEVPFSYFLEGKRLHYKKLKLFEQFLEVPFYDWKHHTIWGATARMIHQLVECLTLGKTEDPISFLRDWK